MSRTARPSRPSRARAGAAARAGAVAGAVAAALVLVPAVAGTAAGRPFPDTVALPGDFSPEGIAGGRGTTFYAGSRPGPTGGAVYVGDLRTGEGELLVAPTPGGASIGMTFDSSTGVLWVAGGPTGTVTGYDGDTGEVVARYTAPAAADGGGRFLNDVDVSGGSVYVTDSLNAELVVVPRRPADGGGLTLLPLTGDWAQTPTGNNANGIRALPGGDLLVVDQGALLVVDPATGVADRLEQTGGRTLTGGDGLELRGSTLYVVFGFGENSVAVVDLDRADGSFAVTGTLTESQPVEDDLERPTTALYAAGSLWVVNGKFASGPTTDQEIVQVEVP